MSEACGLLTQRQHLHMVGETLVQSTLGRKPCYSLVGLDAYYVEVVLPSN